jgi:hypothetical protein
MQPAVDATKQQIRAEMEKAMLAYVRGRNG